MTPTHPGEVQRTLFMRRHIGSIRTAIAAKHRLWQPSPSDGKAAQLVWIVVEDAAHIDAEIASLLMCSGIPFVYFAFGPTNSWGHVQRNAAALVASRLAEVGVAGPGIFLDDDAYVSPWLFEQVCHSLLCGGNLCIAMQYRCDAL